VILNFDREDVTKLDLNSVESVQSDQIVNIKTKSSDKDLKDH